MTGLSELAARVEAAEASEQRAMLEEAWLAVHHEGYPPEDSWDDTCRKCDRFDKMLDAEAYESAAMTLVPEGCLWTMDSWGAQGAARWSAGIWRWKGWLFLDKRLRCATPALALTAAALRAHAAQGARP